MTANADTFERAGGTQDTDDNPADFSLRSPADPHACDAPCAPPPPPCQEAVVPIHEIQGPGLSSPCMGTDVTIEGVVTGVDDQIGQATGGQTFPENAGIFVQDETPDDVPLRLPKRVGPRIAQFNVENFFPVGGTSTTTSSHRRSPPRSATASST
jgi:predicted extracellular nuclease